MKAITILLILVFILAGPGQAQQMLAKMEQEIQDVIEMIRSSVVQVECVPRPVSVQGIEKYLRQFRVIRRHDGKNENVFVDKFLPNSLGDLKDSGVGLVLDQEGYILTGSFVANARRIEVKLADGRKLPAKIKGIDSKTQIALLQVDADKLQPVRLGDSGRLRTGSFILAVGNPYGMGFCTTLGIIGGAAHKVKGQTRLPINIPINPGDRGGAIFNSKGELVGLVDGVIRSSQFAARKNLRLRLPRFDARKLKDRIHQFTDRLRQRIEKELDQDWWAESKERTKRPTPNQPGQEKKDEDSFIDEHDMTFSLPMPQWSKTETGVSLAIPINILKPIISALKANGQVKRGWIGVLVAPVSPVVKAQLPQLLDRYGLQIEDIVADSPAAKAGMQKWDIITKFAGHEITDMEQFRQLVENSDGQTTIEIIRGARSLTLPVEIRTQK